MNKYLATMRHRYPSMTSTEWEAELQNIESTAESTIDDLRGELAQVVSENEKLKAENEKLKQKEVKA